MGFKSLENHNPFVYVSLVLFSLLIARYVLVNRPGRMRIYALMVGPRAMTSILGLGLASLVLAIVFEVYFRVYKCRVSHRFYEENISLAVQVLSILKQAQVPYWLDYATLLCALRGQTINAWDHDTDFSTIHPDYRSSTIEAFITLFKSHGLDIGWFESRNLIQIWKPGNKGSGGHIDMWLWTPTTHSKWSSSQLSSSASLPPPPSSSVSSSLTASWSSWWASSSKSDTVWLKTSEEGVVYNPRHWTDIFPLVNMTWLGISVTIPRLSHAISEAEFQVYDGSYMVPAVFRGDCFHNFFNARFAY